MQPSVHSKLLRSLLFGGTASAALLSASPAMAVSVSNIVLISAQSNGAQCDISFSATVTNNGVAAFTSGISTTATGSPTIGALAGSTFGTLLLNRTIPATLTSPPVGPLYIQFFGSPNVGPPGSLARLAIPNATLQTAGGACLNLIPNLAPTANAGPDVSVRETQQVVLAGSGTDPENQPLTYSWAHVGGLAGTLSATNVANPTLTAPSVPSSQQATYALTVSDGISTHTDQVTVNYLNNAAPVTSAPLAITQAAGTTFTLAGATATDADNDPLTLLWQFGGGLVSFNIVSGANTLTPQIQLPSKTNSAQQVYARFDASDGIESANPRFVEINMPANIGATANAGTTITAGGGSVVNLNGAASADGDGDPLTYSWTQLTGPSVALTGANTATPNFTAPPTLPVLQTLTFQLVVNDGFGNSAPSIVMVNVPTNAPPVVNAGVDQTAPAGSAVTLAGTATDLENDPLTYQWTQTGGTPVTLTGATTLTASFTAPPKTSNNQVLTFSLTANDGTSASTADAVEITIPANLQPSPSAGPDQTVSGGQTVTLTAAGSSDPDGDSLSYLWTQVAGPTVTLTGANTSNPTFVAPPGGSGNQTLTFSVTVSDPLTTGDPPTDLVDIVVLPNAPPVADAGADQGPINTGQTVTLSGGASTDPDGNPLTYSWTQVSGPTVTLINPTSANPTFVAPSVAGTQNLVFQLVVNDGSVDSAPDTVTIAVRAVGTVTVIQRVVGSDGSFTYASDITALAGTITTSGGTGQRSATLVPAGSHTLAAGDARAAGYVVTSISCNDSDSVANLAGRSVAVALSPNENLVCTLTSTNTREAAVSAITNFVTARNGALLANQPDLQRRLDRLSGISPQPSGLSAMGVPVPGSNHLPVSMSYSADRAHAATSLGMVRSVADREAGLHRFDLWTEANFGSLSYPGHKGNFRLVYVGADYLLGSNVLVGGVAQFDRFKRTGGLAAAGAAEGDGWLAGPYATVRLSPSFYVDLRAAWGSSDNRVSPLGTYVDSFKTSRGLYSGSLIGQFAIGGSTELRPEFTVRYLDEQQKTYTDTFGVAIPGHALGMGDISFRPRLQHTIEFDGGWSLRPYGEAQGILTFGSDAEAVIENALRMRVEGGFDLASPGNLRLGLSGFHDGIGSDGFRNSGVRATASFGF